MDIIVMANAAQDEHQVSKTEQLMTNMRDELVAVAGAEGHKRSVRVLEEVQR